MNQLPTVLRLQQQWVIWGEKLSLCTQFGECSEKDRQLEPIVHCLWFTVAKCLLRLTLALI